MKLRAGQPEGQGVDHFAAQPPVAGDFPAGEPLVVSTHQRDRQLIGEQLVIGEALPRKGSGGKRRLVGGGVELQERRAPVHPTVAALQRGVQPFR